MTDFNIDLKWSAWTCYEDIWLEREPEAYNRLINLKPGERTDINSSPRKEIRYLHVSIGRLSTSTWVAEGYVTCSWDEPYELAGTLGVLIDGDTEYDEIMKKAGEDHELAYKLAEEAGYNAVMPLDYLQESIPHSYHTYEPGVDVDFKFKARSLKKLMKMIDDCEDACMKDSDKAWDELETMFRKKK
jgi:hypothetical protein